MADYARHLPLSQRQESDESGVSTDWREPVSQTLARAADLLAALTPEQWESPSLCAGWSVRDVAGHLAWRVGSSNRQLLGSGARTYFGSIVTDGLNPNRTIDALSRAAAEASPAELVARLRQIAVDKAAGDGRHGIGELTEVVVHGYDLAQPLGLALPVGWAASGAVALRRSLMSPLTVRVVLTKRTLVATDAGWRVGHGPELTGTAEAIVLYLFGRRSLADLA
ncbi:maleylpyruvate isomerase family mycothiol-dependent enzyme [Glaciibacter superstes]|uniref:maleylpyruvate isomerase family mycothiol-dependent enzyme n=1 Tax=Glaciibacter superstes TaxID=501023 RepID=UPI0003B4C8F8|nr:maleylpyruvate isomerase family mycothiol-dependent enzyme [Glaciibacter superstes]